MALRFRCPECQQVSAVAGEATGQTVTCPGCGKSLVVGTRPGSGKQESPALKQPAKGASTESVKAPAPAKKSTPNVSPAPQGAERETAKPRQQPGAASSQSPATQPVRRQLPPRRRAPVLLWSIGAGALLLVAVAVLAVVFWKKDDSQVAKSSTTPSSTGTASDDQIARNQNGPVNAAPPTSPGNSAPALTEPINLSTQVPTPESALPTVPTPAGQTDRKDAPVVSAKQPALNTSETNTQDQDAALVEGLKQLQGQWVFEKAERNGGGRVDIFVEEHHPVLYIENNIMRGTNKDGNLHSNSARAGFRIDPTASPMTIDITLQNDSPGTKFQGIYKIEGNRITMALNTSNRDLRPIQFTTKLTAGPERATDVLVYQRSAPTVAEQKAPTPNAPKLTQDELDLAIAKEMKNLQGLWEFEKVERNDAGRVNLFVENYHPVLYIENNIVRGTNKSGKLHSNSARAEIRIDPASTPMNMDIILQNDSPGTKFQGIYKIEGNRLTLALNTSNRDLRPAQFTTKLTAGLERTTDVLVYRRAAPTVAEQKGSTPNASKLTQDQLDAAIAEGQKNLQGQWMFEKAERNGGGRVNIFVEGYHPVLYVENDIMRGTNKNGILHSNSARAGFRIDPTASPMTIDITLQNDSPGTKFQGIYKIEGNRLTLALNTSNQDLRPTQFTTKITAGPERATDVLVYRRVPPTPTETKEPSKDSPKLSQEQLDAAIAAEMKKLQGQWIFDKAERNDAGRVNLFVEEYNPALYIENNIVRGTNKKGDLHSNSARAEIRIDPASTPMNMDIILQNDSPGTKFQAIYKIEGNRLTIAMNTSNLDRRPTQFTIGLTAGLGRATDVLVYKRANK